MSLNDLNNMLPFWWTWHRDLYLDPDTIQWTKREDLVTDFENSLYSKTTMNIIIDDLELRAKVMIEMLEHPHPYSNPDYLILMAQRLANRLEDSTELDQHIKLFISKHRK